MAPDADPKKRSRIPWRLIGALAVIAVVILIAIGIALSTGEPQQWTAHRAITSITGGPAIVEGVHIGENPSVDHLAIYDDDSSFAADAPALELEGLRVDVDWQGLLDTYPRYFDSVEIDHIALRAERDESGHGTYDFQMGDASVEPLNFSTIRPYLPRNVHVEQFDLSYKSPAMDFVIDGVAAAARMRTFFDWSLTVEGRNVTGEYRIAEPPISRTITDGFIDIEAEARNQSVDINSINIDLPGIAQIEGSGDVNFPPLQVFAELNFEKAWIGAIALEPSAFVPIPLAFESLDASGSKIGAKALLGAFSFPDTDVRAEVTALRVGATTNPYYQGNAKMAVSGDLNDLRVDVELEGAPNVHAEITGAYPQIDITASTGAWTVGMVANAFPWLGESLAGLVAPETSFEANADLMYDPAGIAGDITGEISAGDLSVPFKIEDAYYDPGTADVESAFALDDDAVTGALEIFGTEGAEISLALDEMKPTRMLSLLADPPFIDQLPESLSGTIDLTMFDVSGIVKTNIVANELPMFPNLNQPIAIDMQIDYNSISKSGYVQSLRVASGTDLLVQTESFDISLAPYARNIRFESKANIPSLAPTTGIDGLLFFNGETNVAVDVRISGDAVLRNLQVAGIDLSPVAVRAPIKIRIPFADAPIDITPGQVTVGSLLVDVDPFKIGLDPLNMALNARVSGGLTTLADLGYVKDADGTLTADTTITMDEESMNIEIAEANIAAELITLIDDLAAISGIAVKVDGAMGDETAIGGDYAVARAAAAGVILRDMRGAMRFNGTTVGLTIEEGKLFGGRLMRGSASLTLGDEMTITLDTQIRDADLAVFTEEFQPPDTNLTGIVTGYVRATVVGEEITEAEIMLRAPTGFSINKDILRAPLAAQAENNAALRVLLRTWESDGTSEQRHFDAATIRASLEKGAQFIRGEANFISEDLRIGLPLRIDTRVITRALSDQHERLLENLDNIRIAPPEL